MASDPNAPVAIIIPTRLGSVRLPRKVLLAETGKPLIQHVFEAASRATVTDRVVVACDHDEIATAVKAFGGEAVITGEHPNGTSRLEEAARLLGMPDDGIVVNVQGDEPEMEASLVDDAVKLIRETDADVTTIVSRFAPEDDPTKPSVVKAVLTRDGKALYFSRALVPHDRDGEGDCPPLKHIGLYVYRVAALKRYVALPECPLEKSEKLEQLRFLDGGMTIRAVVRESRSVGIDTRADYEAFVSRHRSNKV
ncbi:kdsB [Symbiodinium necroappetens]|uniref:KdsB protein n=1 Tax=Symbiodinium necroappetens TaxID=1628268 RepID=A0A812PSD4_9DINO|nr:kdsB [Symbiodinium necroappetens]